MVVLDTHIIYFICPANVYMQLIVYMLSLNSTVWFQKVTIKCTSLRVLQTFLLRVWRDFPVGKDTCYPSIRTGFRFPAPSHICNPIIGSWGPGEKVEVHCPSSPASSTSGGNKPGSHRVGVEQCSPLVLPC